MVNQHLGALDRLEERLPGHLLVVLLLPAADDSLPALANWVNDTLDPVDEVSLVLMSDGTPDIVSARVAGQLQVHLLQVVTFVALVEITIEPHEDEVVLYLVRDGWELLGNHTVL